MAGPLQEYSLRRAAKLMLALIACAWFTASAAEAAGGETLLIAAAQSAPGKKEGQSEALPPPSFSKPGGVYNDKVSVDLRAKSSSAVIRYTLDGSEPTNSSSVYSEPIVISNSALVRAKTFESGVASPTVSQTYTMLGDDLASFSSNLPLVIITTFGQRISRESKVPVSARFIDTKNGRSSLLGAASFDGRGDINYRGYSSLRFPKRSYTFKTRDDSDNSLKVPILGFPADSDWVLYAPYSDKTLMRDVLAYELSNKMGRYAARTKFVEVFLNRAANKLTRRDYLGVYVFEEKIKRAKDRVNITALKPEDNAEPNITGGYIFKRDHIGPPGDMPMRMFRPDFQSSSEEETGFRTSRGLRLLYVEPKERDLTPEQKSWLKGYLNQFERALNGPNFMSPTQGYAKYLDVDSFIDQHWIVEMSKNVDGFRYSCYMHKDRGGKIKVEPLWDWNLSFGNANYHEGWMTENWYWPLLRQNEIRWVERLLQDPDFAQRRIDRWGELRKTHFDPAKILARIDELAALLNEAQVRNYQRWPVLGQSVNPNWYVGDTYAEEIKWMKQWIQRRIAWIDSQFLPPPTMTPKQGPVEPGTKLSMRGGGGKIYFTTDGTDPRLPGGAPSPKARLYTTPVVLNENTQVFARTHRDEEWSSPVQSRFLVNSPKQTNAVK